MNGGVIIWRRDVMYPCTPQHHVIHSLTTMRRDKCHMRVCDASAHVALYFFLHVFCFRKQPPPKKNAF